MVGSVSPVRASRRATDTRRRRSRIRAAASEPQTLRAWDDQQRADPSRPILHSRGRRQRTHICPVRDFFSL